jgi:hypothetical protein
LKYFRHIAKKWQCLFVEYGKSFLEGHFGENNFQNRLTKPSYLGKISYRSYDPENGHAEKINKRRSDTL